MRGLLVGYGSIGRRHLTNFHAVGVTDWAAVRTSRGTLPFEPPCEVRVHTDLEDALRDESPTFAIVANPTSLHVPTALACVEAGCHVLLEKPIAHTLEGLDALSAAVAEHGVRVLVAYQFRFHPALRRMRELIRDGAIGTVVHARATWGEYLPSWHPWEDWRESHASKRELGGGVLHIAHPLDYLCMLFGEPLEVAGLLSARHPLGLDVPESVDCSVRFDGVDAQVHLDYWAQPQTHRLEITGTQGSIAWNYVEGTFRVATAQEPGWRDEDHPGLESRNTLFVDMARHFLEVIDLGVAPVCSLHDGIREVRLADAIERSSARGGERTKPV